MSEVLDKIKSRRSIRKYRSDMIPQDNKNALDFQLSTLLGYLVAKDTYTNIFVLSGRQESDHTKSCGLSAADY